MKQLFIISALVTGLLLSIHVMAQKDQPACRKTGPVYIVTDANGVQSVLSVTEYRQAGDSSRQYFLKLHTINDHRELKSAAIATTQGRPLNPEQLIGRLGDIFYVVTGNLLGYDVHTLEPVVTETTIVAANPFMKNNISYHHNNYLLDEGAGVLYLRAENDDPYKLYPGSPILKPDDGHNEPAPDEYSYEMEANYSLYDRYTLKDALTGIDTAGNNLYILGSEKETGYVLSYFGTTIYPDREETRQLTIVPYHADGEKLDYKATPPKTMTACYFRGGFLQHKFCTSAWKNNQGERIILFTTHTPRQLLCVALVDKQGNEKWRIETGKAANSFVDYLVADKNLLLWFNKPNKEKNGFDTVVVGVELGGGGMSGD